MKLVSQGKDDKRFSRADVWNCTPVTEFLLSGPSRHFVVNFGRHIKGASRPRRGNIPPLLLCFFASSNPTLFLPGEADRGPQRRSDLSLLKLPANPNLEHLKKQARSLLRERLSLDAIATQRFAAFGISSATPKLADALHVIAREYGFDTWPALKLHIELASVDPIEALIAAIKANDATALRQVLALHPFLTSRIDEPLPNYGFDEPPSQHRTAPESDRRSPRNHPLTCFLSLLVASRTNC
jgi:hypothetical protein